jgi:hypothetical protein
MERSVDGMKLHEEKYSGDCILYNLPELLQGCEKLGRFTSTQTHANFYPNQVCWPRHHSNISFVNNSHVQSSFYKVPYNLAENASSKCSSKLSVVLDISYMYTDTDLKYQWIDQCPKL